jgi:hypothetical protein
VHDRGRRGDDVGNARVPVLADPLEVVGQQQVVVGEPENDRAPGELERAVPVRVGIAGAFGSSTTTTRSSPRARTASAVPSVQPSQSTTTSSGDRL